MGIGRPGLPRGTAGCGFNGGRSRLTVPEAGARDPAGSRAGFLMASLLALLPVSSRGHPPMCTRVLCASSHKDSSQAGVQQPVLGQSWSCSPKPLLEKHTHQRCRTDCRHPCHGTEMNARKQDEGSNSLTKVISSLTV